jgi:hypothetical protein
MDIGKSVMPFSRPLGVSTPGTRYQQAYSSSNFAALGTIDISSVGFLDGNGGYFTPGTYTLSFSTIHAGIDDLSNTQFDSNLGLDNAFFTSATLSGSPPSNLVFTGSSFRYDPLAGNLLLDIQISQSGPQSLVPPATYRIDNQASGVFSRYQDFAGGTVGMGLVTQFGYMVVPEPAPLLMVLAGFCLLATRRRLGSN